MSYFKAEMHQIRFRLGLLPRSRWGSSQRSPDSLAGFKESYTAKGMEGKGEEGRDEKERGGKERPYAPRCKFLAMPLGGSSTLKNALVSLVNATSMNITGLNSTIFICWCTPEQGWKRQCLESKGQRSRSQHDQRSSGRRHKQLDIVSSSNF